MPYMDDFCDDPLTFGKAHAIDMAWGGALIPDEGRFKPRGGNTYDVRGANRIIWFKVDQSPHLPNTAVVQLQEMPGPGFEPAYFLPWQEDQIYRIQLKPSRTTDNDDTYYRQKRGVLKQQRSLVEDTSSYDDRLDSMKSARQNLVGVDPDFFFTAPVDGCSVYVEGTPDAPIVYHANAKNYGGSIHDATTQGQFKQFMKGKVDEMDRYFDTFQQNASKTPVQGNIARKVTIKHYVGQTAKPNLFPDVGAEEMKKIMRKLAENGTVAVKRDKIEVTKRSGTIFGKRTGGQWEFYVQNRIEVRHVTSDYKKAVAKQGLVRYGVSWGNPVDYWHWWNETAQTKQFSFSMKCKPFWPDGVGSLVYY